MNITVFFNDGGVSAQVVTTWAIRNGSLILDGRKIPLSRIKEVRPGVHHAA